MNMEKEQTKQEEVKEEKPQTPQPEPQATRQIILETDGTGIKIIKAEVSNLEFQAILENLLRAFREGKFQQGK